VGKLGPIYVTAARVSRLDFLPGYRCVQSDHATPFTNAHDSLPTYPAKKLYSLLLDALFRLYICLETQTWISTSKGNMEGEILTQRKGLKPTMATTNAKTNGVEASKLHPGGAVKHSPMVQILRLIGVVLYFFLSCVS
jgi:hypothetical protein